MFREGIKRAIDYAGVLECRRLHIPRLLPVIGHVQVADMPGRHEPGSGDLDYPSVFAAIRDSAYDGWVGAEYRPAGETSAGLGWRNGL